MTKKTTAKGMLIQKTERQSHSARIPPSAGPRPLTRAEEAAQMPMAVPRCAGSNASVMIESDAGVRTAAPTPMTTTEMIKTIGSGATAAPSAPSV